MIKFFDYARLYSNFVEDIEFEISNVIRSGSFINGRQVGEFEEKFRAFLGARYCVGVSSGTDALSLALMTLNRNERQHGEVICPSFTFIASAMTAIREKFLVRFVDTQPMVFKPSIESVIECINQNTIAIVWPHLFGEPTDLSLLRAYCDKVGIMLIEDCAQAVGTIVGQKHVGMQGHYGCFSFFPAKNLGAFGDGGAIVVDDRDMQTRILKSKNHGYAKSNKYCSERIGGNFRLDTIQAAILNVLIQHLPMWLSQRASNAFFYEENISNDLVQKPAFVPGHSWNQYTLIVDDNRKFVEYMRKLEIETMIYYPIPLHKNPIFDSKLELVNTEELCRRVVSIPIYPRLSMNEIEFVVEKVNKYE